MLWTHTRRQCQSRTHKGERESQGANISTKQSAVSLREQARALDQNHDIVIGILDKMEERVIGSRGIHIEPQPLNLSGDVDEALAEQIRKKMGGMVYPSRSHWAVYSPWTWKDVVTHVAMWWGSVYPTCARQCSRSQSQHQKSHLALRH